MTPVIDETRLRELEDFYRANMNRHLEGTYMWHFNSGRMWAIADLRLELGDNITDDEFTFDLSPKSSRR